jgi:hypothetical protein
MISMSFFIAHKKGGSIASDPFKENIEYLINDWDLLDIKPIKGKYTWTNKRSGHGHIVSRLDRFLVHSSHLLQDDTFKSNILPSHHTINPFLSSSKIPQTMVPYLSNLIHTG